MYVGVVLTYEILFVVADTATQIVDLRDEAHLGARLGLARFREHVAYFVDLPILRSFVDVLSECVAFGVFYRPPVFTQYWCRGGDSDAICEIEAEGIEIAVFEPIRAGKERRDRFGFVGFHRGHGFVEHRSRLGGGALREGGS